MRKIPLAVFLSLFLLTMDIHVSIATEKISVIIKAGNNSPVTIKTNTQKVWQVLKEAGIKIRKEDRANPNLKTILTDGMFIEVTFVDQRIFTERSVIPIQTVVKEDKSMPVGTKIIMQSGYQGLAENTIRIYYKNGEETTRGIISQKILITPVDEICIIGTKTDMEANIIASRGLPDGGGKFRIVDIIDMDASAYDPSPLSCGPYANGYTAMGIKAGYGVVAVDPSFIPLGTPLYVEGYGYALAADKGSAIINDRIDLCYDSYWEAIMFGRKKVKVYILDYAN